VEINMIGSVKFSSPEMLAAINVLGEKLARLRGGNVRINVYKSIKDEKKREILNASDIMVLPSYHEGFCLPILEAFSSGCRVIAYDNSNIPDISSGHATLVETGDIPGLARAIETMMRELSTEAWRAGTAAGYLRYKNDVGEYCKQYSLGRIGNKINGIIESVLSNRGNP
jgi:glycosyltransferase involved in cell wall biosynthesis